MFVVMASILISLYAKPVKRVQNDNEIRDELKNVAQLHSKVCTHRKVHFMS